VTELISILVAYNGGEKLTNNRIQAAESFQMSQGGPLTPIVIHPDSEVSPSHTDNYSGSFFCLDSEEFGDLLAQKVTELRRISDQLVPVVVIGASGQRLGAYDEAKRIANAGAIYFERPEGNFKLDDFAQEICRELAQIYEGAEPSTQQPMQPPELSEEQKEERKRAFSAHAAFRLAEMSLGRLLKRL